MTVAEKKRQIEQGRKPHRIAACIFLAILLIVGLIWLIPKCLEIVQSDVNPDALFPSMVYMLWHSRNLWLSGVWGTLSVSALGTVIGFLLAVLLAFVRSNQPAVRDRDALRFLKQAAIALEKGYVTIIRGTPMMVQACIVYYGGFMITRAAMPNATITEVNRIWSFFTAALITVSLNSAAYLAEVLRGGIESLDIGQTEAAVSLGFTRWQTMRKIVFPQALRNCLPSVGNELINNIKGTSVLNVIGFVELMFATGSVAGFYYKYLANYIIAAVIYLILTLSLTSLLNVIMKKASVIKTEAKA